MIKHHHPKKLMEGVKYSKEDVLEHLSDSQYMLGMLEGSHKRLENPTLLLSPLITKEATVSSKIEGTQSTVTDVFAFEAGAETASNDANEVLNYRIAMFGAMENIKDGKRITKSLLKGVHSVLLKGVRRNTDSVLGDFRNKTVWVGKEGTPIEQAKYIPPEHFLVNDYIEDIIKYIESSNEKSLLKSAIVHYQFEAVHPFDDGNGRIGRLLIPLMLCTDRKITFPILYISGYFEKYKDEYVSALRAVDETGDFTKWLIFFMKAVEEQLIETQGLIDSIYHLYSNIKSKYSSTSYRYDIEFIDFIFRKPVFTINDILKEIKMNRLTAKNLIDDFIEKGLVEVSTIIKKRSKVYIFRPLINILSK